MDKAVTIGVHTVQDRMNFLGIRKICRATEDLGFDSVTVMDHFRSPYLPKTGNMLECWTTLGALAMETKKVKIGSLVTCASFRNPALVAKMAACIDHMSQGRLKFGIGAGKFHEEVQEYGQHFGRPKERIERLREAIQIIRKLWTEDEASFHGKYYQINSAACEPKPVQKPYPPILIGGRKEKMLKLIAEVADAWNTGGSLEQYTGKLNILKGHCEEIRRDWKEIKLSYMARVILSSDPSEIAKYKSPHIRTLDDYADLHLIGTPDQCIEKMNRLIDLGVSDFELIFPDTYCSAHGQYVETPSLRTMERFAQAVLPHFRT